MNTRIVTPDTIASDTFHAASVTAGRVSFDEVTLDIDVTGDRVEDVRFAVFTVSGEVLTYPLVDHLESGKHVVQCSIQSDQWIASSLGVLVLSDLGWQKLPTSGNADFMDRVLSTDMFKINANLRWRDRIANLRTRYLASQNTYRYLLTQEQTKDIIQMRAYCTLSVGYSAIEQSEPKILDWAIVEATNLLERTGSEKSKIDFISVLAFLGHAAIYFQRHEDLVAYGKIALETIEPIPREPLVAYNLSRLALLVGGFCIATRQRDLGVEILTLAVEYFALYGAHATRPTVNLAHLREMQSTCGTHRFCRLLLRDDIEVRPKSQTQPDVTIADIWNYGCRIYEDEARSQNREKFRQMVLDLGGRELN